MNSEIKLQLMILKQQMTVKKLMFLVLLLLVIMHALVVIYVAHLNRIKTIEYRAQQKQQLELQREWETLKLEQSALTEHSRIRDLASRQLYMKFVDNQSEIIIQK